MKKSSKKNETKNKTFDKINRIIPHRNPGVTASVWRPWNVPSRETSRPQGNFGTFKAFRTYKCRWKLHY